ncbi:PREDICTED: protein prenyltransferase alpha subunit repeat-containing protein 1-B [Polistes dominula]|uniref:Protein prenyltransferase alpha subunit repeat-containing protein 1-B n=1 Tax=Polistes dominula TaxID=743375 RepID=A0ABM1JCR5_POLDO|nr:PREDICTED: protein prenyltransferase alpha subunit repeat-containing protein 1-B [Polistes dominula]
MQEDIFPAAEKILSDLENVLKKNSSLKSFEIIPCEDNENKSPVFHQEDSLGLASWCVQPLYCYTHRRLLEHRGNKHRREDPSIIARWLSGALLLNPDTATFWNMRRELVKSNKLDVIEELAFTRLALYVKARSFDALSYRRWLLPYVLNSEGKNYDLAIVEPTLTTEMIVNTICANRYPTNYHAWSHRKCVMILKEFYGHTNPSYEKEWKDSLAWCQLNVSDYSGQCYRQYLLEKFLLATDINSKDNLLKCVKSSDYQSRCHMVMDYVSDVFYLTHDNNSQSNQESNDNEKNNDSSTTQHCITSHTLDLLHGKARLGISTTTNSTSTSTITNNSSSSSNLKLEPWQICFLALSYWVEECKANEECIKMYEDHEALWSQRRYLAHLLLRFIESYKKYSYYKSDIILDYRRRPTEQHEIDEIVYKQSNDKNQDKNKEKAPLIQAFLNRTREITDLAAKRGSHEQFLVEKCIKYLGDIHLQF